MWVKTPVTSSNHWQLEELIGLAAQWEVPINLDTVITPRSDGDRGPLTWSVQAGDVPKLVEPPRSPVLPDVEGPAARPSVEVVSSATQQRAIASDGLDGMFGAKSAWPPNHPTQRTTTERAHPDASRGTCRETERALCFWRNEIDSLPCPITSM